MKKEGRFLVLEGCDGSGKGVQSKALLAAMQNADLQVILTREPGGSEGAELIRQLIVEGDTDRWDDITELLLIYAARRSHLRDTIWPALEAGNWVISDRFADSSRAFQGGAGSLGLEVVETLHQQVVGDFVPFLTLVLDIDPKISLARAEARGGKEDRFEQKGLSYQQAVRETYHSIVSKNPESHVLINGDQSIDNVTKDILNAVNARCNLSLSTSD